MAELVRAVFAHTRIDLRQYRPEALAQAVSAFADADRNRSGEGLLASLRGPTGHAGAWGLASTLESRAWADILAMPPPPPQLDLVHQQLARPARADGSAYWPRVWLPACPDMAIAERVKAWLAPRQPVSPVGLATHERACSVTWLATGAPMVKADEAGADRFGQRPDPCLQWRRHRALHEPAPGVFDLVVGHAWLRSVQPHVRRRLLQQLLTCLTREGLLWVDLDSMSDAFAVGWHSTGVIGLLQRPPAALATLPGTSSWGATRGPAKSLAPTTLSRPGSQRPAPVQPPIAVPVAAPTDTAALAAELPRALAAGELVLHYQPQFDVASGRLTGAEALVRWQHPQRGLILPDAFIGHAETLGLIDPLGDWVLACACRQLAHWRHRGLPPLRLAVNVSGLQLKQPHFFTRLNDLLSETGLPADRLELELTESALLPTSGAQLSALAQCRQAGIGLCLDDFGTGHSTMGALHQLPVDRLKIDRSFIRGLPGDITGQAIVRAAIGLSRDLHLDVVAEGVETTAQLDFLRRNACRAFQGHLGAPALAPIDFEPWLTGSAALPRSATG